GSMRTIASKTAKNSLRPSKKIPIERGWLSTVFYRDNLANIDVKLNCSSFTDSLLGCYSQYLRQYSNHTSCFRQHYANSQQFRAFPAIVQTAANTFASLHMSVPARASAAAVNISPRTSTTL